MAENGNLVKDQAWRKSSYSGGSTPNCVEVATGGGAVLVRDSKSPQTPALRFDRATWSQFLTRL